MMNMIQMLDKKLHMRRFQANLRRSVAGALAAAMLLPMTTTFAAPVGGLAPIKKAAPEDFPDIEIEGNIVRDEFGFTTGFFELGLRVKTPANGVFRQLNVSLQYDKRFLTPVDWSANGNEIAVSYTGNRYYQKQLPTQGLSEISTATALTGEPSAGVAVGDPAVDNKAFMTFVVNSYEDKEFPDMTTLAVVRFRIAEDYMDHITITKSGADDYSVKYGTTVVTDANGLFDAIGSTPGIDKVRPVEFTPDAYIEASVSNVPMALEYKAGVETVVTGTTTTTYDNRYYHIPDYDPSKPTTYDPGVTETIEGKTYTFGRVPKTKNKKLYAWDPNLASQDTATQWGGPNVDNGRLSYISNLIVNTTGSTGHTYIKFPIVTKRSFVDQTDLLGNMTTIVYVDWDNTLLGTQIVPKNADVRGLVSDYVAENFIYHDDDDTAYGLNDLNNPANGAKRDSVTAESIVSSLERKYNYRGKYIATGPAADGTPDPTIVDNNAAIPGSKYSLSNKLDYVFFKRPMEHTNEFDTTANPKPSLSDLKPGTTDPKYTGATDPNYIADLKTYNDAYNAWFYDDTEWSQKTVNDDGTTPYWDVEHPYAYGWAQCTIDNYQDVWTTLGMGELGSEASVSESNTKGSTKGYSGASTGGYNAIPSGKLASVTYDGDAAFAFADLEKGFSQDQDTVFLKAVYEPGVDLLGRGYRYRMSKEPYYNKFNNKSASGGGAYQVSVTFERASEEVNDELRGVARIREPVVRQDTTTDLRWEESTTPAVDHDLTNATNTEAYTGKGKTTYTKVDVANLEEISFDMALSARQNKVDFALEENYGMNFVTAGSRTSPNGSRTGEEFTVDNYNYFVDGDPSMLPSTYYAPTLYEEREGTAGFVLYGTLNYLMEQATLYARNEITSGSFRITVNASLNDANLKKTGGDPITAYGEITTVMNTLKQAALDAETHKGAADEADYWNAERDCAQLNYHQVQQYLLSAGLLSPSVADDNSHKITWCHLHDACAALNSGKPVSWKDLIAKAASNSKTDIEKLTPTEIETNFRLRKDENGATGWTSATFADAVIKAVDELIKTTGVAQASITWDQVQYVINNPGSGKSDADMGTHGTENYWWYDGEDVDSFADLLAAADDAHTSPLTAAKLPDATTNVASRPAKLNRIKKTFDDNMAAAVDKPTTDWINLTENLAVKEDSGNKAIVERFADFDDFKAKLIAAVHETGTSADWYDVQYTITNNGTKPSKPLTETEKAALWWHNGAGHIYDLASMLTAANDGGATWDNFDFDAFSALKFYFAYDLKGTAITSANFAAVKPKIKAYAAAVGNISNATWSGAQYYIIHSLFNTTYSGNEAPYYWWKNNGSKTPMSFTLSSTTNKDKADELAKLLSDAYFRVTYNGYDDSETWGKLTNTDLQNGRLVAGLTGTPAAFPNDFTMLDVSTDLTTVKDAVSTAFSNVQSDKLPYTPVTWENIQAYILNDPSITDYWWKEKDAKGNDPQTDFDNLSQAFADYVNNPDSTTEAALQAAFTVDVLKNIGVKQKNKTDVDQTIVNTINGQWSTILSNSKKAGAFKTLPVTTISWEEIQFLIISKGTTGKYQVMKPAQCTAVLKQFKLTKPGTIKSREAANLALMPAAAPAAVSAEAMTTNAANTLTTLQSDETLRTELAGSGYTDNLIAQVELLTGQKVVLTEVLPTESPVPTVSPEPSASAAPTGSPAPTESVEPAESVQPTESPKPTASAEPTVSPTPTESPEPTESAKPTESPKPTGSTEPAESPEPTESAKPTESPEPTESPKPTGSTEPTESPEPTESAKPTESPGAKDEDAGPVESPPAADPGGGEDDPPISEEGDSGGVPDVSLGLTFAELRERGRITSYSDRFRAPLIIMMYGRTLA